MEQEYYYVAGFDKEDDCTFDVKVLKQDFLASHHYDEIDPEIRDKLEDKQYMIDYEVEMEELPDVYAVMHILEDCDDKLSRSDWKYTTNFKRLEMEEL